MSISNFEMKPPLHGCKFLPNSDCLVTSYNNTILHVYNPTSPAARFHDEFVHPKFSDYEHSKDQPIQVISCVPDGTAILTASLNENSVGMLNVWDNDGSGKFTKRIDSYNVLATGTIRCCAISPDKSVAIYCETDKFCAVHLQTMEVMNEAVLNIRDYENSHSWAAARGSFCTFSTCGNLCVAADSKGRVWIFGGQKKPTTKPFTIRKTDMTAAHLAEVSSCAFGPNNTLVTAGYDNVARIWKLNVEEIMKIVANNSERFVVNSNAEVARGCQMVALLSGHRSLLNDVCFSGDGRYIATASADSTLRMWAADDGSPLVLLALVNRGRVCEFSSDSSRLLVGDMNGKVQVHNVEEVVSLGVKGAVKAMRGSGSKWSQETAIMIAIAGGAGFLDASATESGGSAINDQKVKNSSGGKNGEGGKGYPFQGGFGGAGWKTGAINSNPSSTQNNATLAVALSDPNGLFLGGFLKMFDGATNRFGGLGGGGTGWYGSGGGGGYSGGGGSGTNGRGGGGGSYLALGIEGLRKSQDITVTNTGPGKVWIMTPSGKKVYIAPDMDGQKEKKDFDLITPVVGSELFFETSGVVVFEVTEAGMYHFSVHGAGCQELDKGCGADISFSLNLEVGSSVGVLTGNRPAVKDMGSGATILWLGSDLQQTFINSLTVDRATSALRLLSDGAQVDDEVCNALLNSIHAAGDKSTFTYADTKWALLLADSSADSIKLADMLFSSRPDRLKVPRTSSMTLLTALTVGREEGAERLLDLGAAIDEVAFSALVSERVGVVNETRLTSLVKNDRSWNLVRRLVKDHRTDLGDWAMFEAVRCKVYDLCKSLRHDGIKITEKLVDKLMDADNDDSELQSYWTHFIHDVQCLNELMQYFISFSVSTLGFHAVLVFFEMNKFDCALEILKLWPAIQVRDLYDTLVRVTKTGSTLFHDKVKLVESAEIVHFMVWRDQRLIESVDSEDRPAYDVATKVVKLKMDDAVLFCGRFRIISKSPEHKSATSVVLRALDVLENDEAVVVKLMCKEEQYKKELESRTALIIEVEVGDIEKHTITVKIHSASPELKDRWAKEAGEKLGFQNYNYGIVMAAGDRNLRIIYTQERPNLLSLRCMGEEILTAVRLMHDNSIMHGDIKALNFVRLTSDHRLRLIDFDASTKVSDDSDLRYAGSKFSSSCLPPELIAKLNLSEVAKYNDYWTVKEGDVLSVEEASLREKVKPMKIGNFFYVIKTFREDGSDEPLPLQPEKLPYELVKSSEAIDVWALGVLLYQMCTGESLFTANRDDDFSSGKEAAVVFSWTDKIALAYLRKVKDESMRDLLTSMLKRRPSDRPSVIQLLEHPFFQMNKKNMDSHTMTKLNDKMDLIIKNQGGIMSMLEKLDERTKRIEGITLHTRSELSKGVSELKKRISSASDVTIPTIFIICPAVDEKSFRNEAKSMMSSIRSGDPISVGEKSKRLFEKVSSLYDSVSASMEDPLSCMKEAFKRLLQDDDFEMFLLCQICYEPQSSDGKDGVWPIKISRSTDKKVEMAAKILPLAKAGLQVAAVINTAAGIGRLMGYPIPRIPVELINLEFLETDSSVSSFEKLEERLFACDKTGEDRSTKEDPLEGYLMREYQRFLDKEDEGQDWGKLRRIILDEGLATWCCERCAKLVESHPDSNLDDLQKQSVEQEEWMIVESDLECKFTEKSPNQENKMQTRKSDPECKSTEKGSTSPENKLPTRKSSAEFKITEKGSTSQDNKMQANNSDPKYKYIEKESPSQENKMETNKSTSHCTVA